MHHCFLVGIGSGFLLLSLFGGCNPQTTFTQSPIPPPQQNEYDRNVQTPQGTATERDIPSQSFGPPPAVTRINPQSALPPQRQPSAADLLIAAAAQGIGNIFNGTQGVPQPVPPVVTAPNPLKLTIVQTKYEAWWKDCLSGAVYDLDGNLRSSAMISCNKDTNNVGKTVALAAVPYPACNVIRLFVSTYKNEGDTCLRHRGEPGFVCNGPYPSSPDWTRSNFRGSDFFKVYDARGVSRRDPRIVYQDNWALIEATAQRNRNDGKNRMVMGFYEDQPTLGGAGIDFNDFVFNLVGENVRFTVDQGDRMSNERACNSQ